MRQSDLPLGARRVFRVSIITALSLAISYGIGLQIPYLPPLLAFMLSLAPAPPPGPKKLLGLVFVLMITLGVGLVLIPLLKYYPWTALGLIVGGLYLANRIALGAGKGLVGTLLAAGFTIIPAAGFASFPLALAVIKGLILGAVLAVVCQWLVYPFLPEEGSDRGEQENSTREIAEADWISLRATLVLVPPFLFALGNPSQYIALIMKSVMLSRQTSLVDARAAGKELLGSTFVAGCFSVLFWFALGIAPNLWMFFLWTLLFTLFFTSKFYRAVTSRFSPSFWQNVATTMIIIVGPAVGDSANGKDVYSAFAFRLSLFVMVTLYAWLALALLEWFRRRRLAFNGRTKEAG